MRWVVWWSIGALAACGKSESHRPSHEGAAGSGANAGSAASMAGTGSSAGGAPGVGGGSSGRAGGSAEGGRSGASGSGSATGGVTSTAGSGPSAGTTSAGTGGASGVGGGEAGGAGTGTAGAAGAGDECGAYVECGCGCCGGSEPSNTRCYYPERGQTLETLREADQAAASDPNCANAGCALGTRRVCCQTPPGADGAGTYTASGYSGGLDHITVTRQSASGRCTTLALGAPAGGETSFAIDLPGRWFVEGGRDGECDADGEPTGTIRLAMGGVGTVSFVAADTACTVTVDATLFFLTDSGEVDAVRLVASDVPATGPLACPSP